MTGYSKPTIYAHIANGKFPRPIPLVGRAVAWEVSEVQEWMRSRMATRDAEQMTTQ
ncbi:helix-turn-helix transcriptional regulator [Variovorax brevis]|uniref:helix-turn-helix transcriptional regulator n=1 Tax=Variovorax brevis TaxID=3053503 RepID=UPI0033659943